MSLSRVLGNPNLVGRKRSCRTSLKAGVGDKIKEGMEKGRKRGGKENLGIETGKDGFQDGGRSRCAGFGDIQGTEAIMEALENELNKQGLGGQNALEKMKEIENKY
jgi:hypothetical protein